MKTKILLGIITIIFFACSKEKSLTTNTTVVKDTLTREKIIEIKTNFGSIYMWLYKETPLHRANFLALADSHYFNNSTFHRCVNNFVIQGGDPNSKDTDSTNDGTGGPSYTIPAEINTSNVKLTHTYGAVGAARLGNTVNPLKASNGSQFYIVVPTAGTVSLNGEYTVFGHIIKGMDVAAIIVKQPKNANNRPYMDIKMNLTILEKTIQELKDEFNFVP